MGVDGGNPRAKGGVKCPARGVEQPTQAKCGVGSESTILTMRLSL